MAHLPGQSAFIENDEWGNKCYAHPEILAVKRICTESDSFGSEFINFCQTCWDEYQQAKEDKKNNPDEWETCKCGNREPDLISYRDPDEGMHGPVYHHCSVCHEKWNQHLEREWAMDNDDDDHYIYGQDCEVTYTNGSNVDEDYHDPAWEQVGEKVLTEVIKHFGPEWRVEKISGRNGDTFVLAKEVRGWRESRSALRKVTRHLKKLNLFDEPVSQVVLTHYGIQRKDNGEPVYLKNTDEIGLHTAYQYIEAIGIVTLVKARKRYNKFANRHLKGMFNSTLKKRRAEARENAKYMKPIYDVTLAFTSTDTYGY